MQLLSFLKKAPQCSNLEQNLQLYCLLARGNLKLQGTNDTKLASNFCDKMGLSLHFEPPAISPNIGCILWNQWTLSTLLMLQKVAIKHVYIMHKKLSESRLE